MKLAAILSVLACGVTAAMWLRVSPVIGNTGWAPAAGLIGGALLGGIVLDRSRHKLALIVGLALLSGGLWRLLLGPASHLALVLGSGLVAAGAAMSMLAASAVVLQTTILSHGSALAVLNVVLPVGMLCNPVLSPSTISYAAATLATLSLAAAIATPMAEATDRARDGIAPHVIPLIVLFALFGLYEGVIWNWVVPFLGAIHVLDRSDAWQVLSYGVPLGLIVGRIGVARILANVKAVTVLRFNAAAMAFAAGLLLLARSPSACWVAAFCLGVAMSPVLPATLALSNRVLPRSPGMGMGVVFASGAIGLAASVPLIEALSARFGLPGAMLLLAATPLPMALVGIRQRQ